MAVSRVPGSRKSLKLFGYAGLQAHRKRRSRNPRLEALEDRVQPQTLNFMRDADALGDSAGGNAGQAASCRA